MQKKLAAILFSTRLTAVLFIVFAVAMAVGTFMDQGYERPPSPYAREMIFNTWWFEAIMVIFVINFIGNIFRFRLLRKEKWATLLLHISFILILVGAFVTRYIGFEGVMHIREGNTENTFLSDQTYLTTLIDGDYRIGGVLQRRSLTKLLRLSERLDNNFTIATDYNKQPVTIQYKGFIENAKEDLIPSENGDSYFKIVEAGDGNRNEHWLKVGEVANIHNLLFAVNKNTPGAINIAVTDSVYTIESPFEGSFMRMADQLQGQVLADSVQPLMLRSLYQLGGTAFVFPESIRKGEYGIVKASHPEKTGTDALILEVTSNNETQTVNLLGGKGLNPAPVTVDLDGLKVSLAYGSKAYELPFSITLNDFIADKYPGTEKAYAAFKSKITVNNSETDFFDEEIFMNHVLDHQGYRFFQASFDPDEKGTILSVNHDWWGTWITYIGYFLLYIGLLAILLAPGSRFKDLEKMLNKIKDKKKSFTTVVLLFLSLTGFSQETGQHLLQKTEADSIIKQNIVSEAHAEKFGRLIIQDNGRMKPVNTFASELLRKVSGKNSYEGFNPDQVFLSMTEFPTYWYGIPIIKLDWRNDSIKKVLGVPEDTEGISLIDLFDERGNNKIDPYIQEASSKTNPNQFEKDFIKLYEKSYLLNEALGGGILKVFPIPGDSNNKWLSYPELDQAQFKGMDSLYAKNILPLYFDSLRSARKTGDYSKAEEFLESITGFQKRYGSEVLLSEKKVDVEILYNKADLFNRLYHYYIMFGAFMFIFIIFQIFKERNIWKWLINLCKIAIWILFVLMTAGLVVRWYISGHAPWSDAYESIIYVSWATMLFGLIFGRKSHLTIASTAFVASMLLWVAHLSWVDPGIANLPPVLDSYWLMIHVAVIVASYGPFTLGMILGAVALLLMLLTTKKNKVLMDLNIKEITIITEMSLTVGLVMLTIGNFLGGQWANESWGRYWGWDPKETWALISIMIYAFVIHARLVPGLRGRWIFNVFAIFAYASIMMTYFGVNFYLTGLHSYASGDVPVTPNFVYYLVLFFVLLSFFSYFQYKKYYIKKED
ncbi:MAG: cytochrome c biogenesis protein CcsA [Flavobacteriaceae bacterium]|nr:cytochrome c biogenesis protein CcsA [Flavobacteriaceae bacterium]